MFEKTVRGWLKQKSLEIFGEANDIFVALVLNLLHAEADDREFFNKLERVLDKDTQPFIKSLWRYVIFEQLKLKHPFRSGWEGRN